MSSAAEVLLELLKIDWEDESPVPIMPLVQQPDAELHQCSNTFSDLAAAAVAVRNSRAKQPPAASLPTADGQGAGWCWWKSCMPCTMTKYAVNLAAAKEHTAPVIMTASPQPKGSNPCPHCKCAECKKLWRRSVVTLLKDCSHRA